MSNKSSGSKGNATGNTAQQRAKEEMKKRDHTMARKSRQDEEEEKPNKEAR